MLIFNFFLIGGFFYELNRGVFDWADLHNIKELSIIVIDINEEEISANSLSPILNKNINYFSKSINNNDNSVATRSGFFN